MSSRVSLLLFTLALTCPIARSEDFRISGSVINVQRQFSVSYPSTSNAYYILYRGERLTDINQVVAVKLGENGIGQLIDPTRTDTAAQGYYRVRQVPNDQSLDSDGDGIPDVYELQHPGFLNPLSAADASLDYDGDGRSNLQEFLDGSNPADLPPDPAAVVSTLSRSGITWLADATRFLYTGSNPIQTGVAPGTFDAQRVCVLRGRVTQRDGTILPGVTISVLDHPEFGQTKTRADGMFDLAVNGGGRFTVNFARPGYCPVQRPTVTPWADYLCLPAVVMITMDPAVTPATFGTNAPSQVVRGTMQSDPDGARRATLILQPGTCANLVLNGATQSCGSLNLRATEFTVGDRGPTTMPGQLPANSAYTYCVELSADEAGQGTVQFTKPLCFYLENFLNFPVGQTVPSGFYDRQKGAWAASQNGRVIKVLSINNGAAVIDANGDGAPDDASQLAALGFTDEELHHLATLYGPQTLWRTCVTHFSPWDCNWPYGPPPDAQGPPVPPRRKPPDLSCGTGGSLIEVEQQALGEMVEIVGTPYHLHYHSDRVRGYLPAYTLEIPLSEASPPPSLKRITLQTEVVGRVFNQEFPPDPDQRRSFLWDGLDAYGRFLPGTHPVTVRIGYVYDAAYLTPSQFEQAFATFSDTVVAGNHARKEITLSKDWKGIVGNLLSDTVGLGSWTIDIHHAYDPRSRTLHYGDGRRRSAAGLQHTVITTFAGGAFASANNGDGGPATAARLSVPTGLAVAPDGTLYIAEGVGNRVRKVTPNGIISTVAGSVTGQSCGTVTTNACGDGGPAVLALLNDPQGLGLATDGTLYIADRSNNRIRKIDASGIITTVAGTGVFGYSGDGGPATQARLNQPYGVSVAPDGSIYIADMGNARVRRVGLDGVISTVVGTGVAGFNGDGRPAIQTQLSRPYRAVFGPDENLYIVDQGQNRIRKVGIDGIVTTVAGSGGISQFAGDGGDATLAKLNGPEDMAFASDGSFYIGDRKNERIRFVGGEGIISTVAGNGIERYSGDGGPATQASFDEPTGLAVGPDGSVFISDWFNQRVRKVSSAMPGFSATDSLIASEDGRELYVFDNAGRHLRTLDAFTRAVRYSFGYDGEGRLSTITDGNTNVTTLERDGSGNPTTIVSPYGQRTTLSVSASGNIGSIANPAGETFTFSYSAGGLLRSMTNPRTNSWTFSYDAMGRLTNDLDPAGGFKALASADTAVNSSVEVHTAMQRTNRYDTVNLANGDRRQIHTFPTGLQAELWERTDGTTTNRFPDGVVETVVAGPDPRWGMLSPLVQSAITQMPNAPSNSMSVERTVTLTNANDPLSLKRWTEVTRVNGRPYTNNFTAATRVMTNSTPTGRRLVTTFDALMRPVREDVPGLRTVQYTYDGRGRLTNAVFGAGAQARTNRFFYNALGYLTNTIDPLGRSTSLEYDLAGRLRRITLPDGRERQHGYDANGNVLAVTPPGRPLHGFSYSAVDLLAEYSPPLVLPGTNSTRFDFNLDRDLALITRPDGLTARFDYTGGGCTCDRLNSIVQPRGTNVFSYHPLTGKPSAISTPDGASLLFSYAGNLLTTQTWTGSIVGSTSYTYDNEYDVASRRLTGGSNIVYQYDADKFLIRAGDLAITRSAQNGLISNTVLGTVTNSWSYNEFAEPTNHRAVFGTTLLYAVQFVRDAAGRITTNTETIGGITSRYGYTYDLASRLTVVTLNGATNATYSYDTNDNRLTATSGGQSWSASYDDQDRLLSYGAAIYTYAANGELATKTVGGQVTSYQYDLLGNLVRVILPNGTTIDYLIDGLNRRVGRKVNGVLTQAFLYDSDNRVVAELDGAGNVVSEFVYGTLENAPDYLIKAGQIYRMICDHLGSPRLMVNATNGQIAQRIDYDAFGRVLVETAPGFQPFGFAGGLYDGDTQLVRFGVRDYDAETGRWTAKDPILFGGGQANLYAYVGNDPLNSIDPNGLEDWSSGPSPQLPAIRKLKELQKQIEKQIEKSPVKPGPQPDFCGDFNKKQNQEKGMQPPPGPGGVNFGFSLTFTLP
jgi:RHS repeat-associated protein